MINAIRDARMVVIGWFFNSPMIFRFEVNMTKGMIANGKPKLSTTWLMTNVRVGSRPIAITKREGSMVATRRNQGGICLWRKPCMIT